MVRDKREVGELLEVMAELFPPGFWSRQENKEKVASQKHQKPTDKTLFFFFFLLHEQYMFTIEAI